MDPYRRLEEALERTINTEKEIMEILKLTGFKLELEIHVTEEGETRYMVVKRDPFKTIQYTEYLTLEELKSFVKGLVLGIILEKESWISSLGDLIRRY